MDSQHGLFPDHALAQFGTVFQVTVLVLPTDIDLVHFHDQVQLELLSLAGFTDTLQQEPRGLLLDAEFFGQVDSC